MKSTRSGRRTSGAAVTSLALGLFGLIGGWALIGLPCLLAAVSGHIGLAATRSGELAGRGMALAGLLLGYASLLILAVLMLVIPADLADAVRYLYDLPGLLG